MKGSAIRVIVDSPSQTGGWGFEGFAGDSHTILDFFQKNSNKP